MKEVLFGVLTFEVALGLDKDLSKAMGRDYSSLEQQHRLVAILFALNDLGPLSSFDRGCETLFYFDEGENTANDVILITLKESEVVKTVELAKRIEPSLKLAWQRSENTDKNGKCDNPTDGKHHAFEIDPFISQLAGWVDKEIGINRPEFRSFDRADRMVRICVELQKRNVSVRANVEAMPVWITSAKIDARVGGAAIAKNEQLILSSGTNARLLDEFQSEAKRHLKRRLKSMLKTQEAFFQMCNAGTVKIGSIDPDGQYQWVLTDAGADLAAELEKY